MWPVWDSKNRLEAKTIEDSYQTKSRVTGRSAPNQYPASFFAFHFLVHVHLLGRVAHLDDVIASLQAEGGGASGSAEGLQQSTANV